MTRWFHQRFPATPKMRGKLRSQCGNMFIPCAPEHDLPPRQALVAHFFLRRAQVLKMKLFLRQWRRNVHVLALHICKSKQNTVRGTAAGPCHFMLQSLNEDRDRSGYFFVNRHSQRSIYQFDP